MRASARAAGSRGNSAGEGYLSSRYSRMIVESKMRASPSIKAGTSRRRLAAANDPAELPEPTACGVSTSNARPFSRSPIFTSGAQRGLGVVAAMQIVAGAELEDDALVGHDARLRDRAARWRRLGRSPSCRYRLRS